MNLNYHLLPGDPGYRKPRAKEIVPIKVKRVKKKPNRVIAWLSDKIEW